MSSGPLANNLAIQSNDADLSESDALRRLRRARNTSNPSESTDGATSDVFSNVSFFLCKLLFSWSSAEYFCFCV